MLRYRVFNHGALLSVLLVVSLVASACYKDAGSDVQPTSRQVNLTDIAPTTPAPPTTTDTPEITVEPEETATRTLVPTTTPAGFTADTPIAVPDEDADTLDAPPLPTAAGLATDTSPAATPTQLMASGASVQSIAATPTQILITTPGMNDILPTATPMPTVDLTNAPTPTAIPVEENPCIYVVQPLDTLYSIAQQHEVVLNDLVAANGEYLGGSALTPLQIGWELQLPGCELEGESVVEEPVEPGEPAADDAGVATAAPGSPVVHVVKAGEGIFAIARLYGVTPQQIIDANNLINPNLIYPGDELIIPVGQ